MDWEALEEWRAARQAIFDMELGGAMKPLFSRLAEAEHKLMAVARTAYDMYHPRRA